MAGRGHSNRGDNGWGECGGYMAVSFINNLPFNKYFIIKKRQKNVN
jgi:hypothetical protein